MRAQWVPRAVVGWLEKRARCALTVNAKGVAAIDECGQIRGMVAVDAFAPASCEMHVALESPMALRCLRQAAFDQLFGKLGLKVVIGVTPADNARALRLNRHVGFKETHRIRDGFRQGVDLVLQELRPPDCAKWAEVSHGQ